MTKSLFLIAGASFFLAAACFGGAAALGGVSFWDNHYFRLPPGAHWTVNFDRDVSVHDDGDRGAGDTVVDGDTVSRVIPFTGGDTLNIDASADVQFTQAPGPSKMTVSGAKDAVDHLVMDGPDLRFDDDEMYSGPLKVTLTAPDVRNFAINGSGNLSIADYAQDDLSLDIRGSGDMAAKGKAQKVRVGIAGSGDADLSGLKTDSADADITGSGRATIAPASAADLHISGNGEIDLLTHPASVNSDVTGSGRIVEGSAASKPS